MNEQKTLFDAWGRWIRKSVTLKLITITFLMLLLLIPAGMIQSIIYERQSMSDSAKEETNAKWARQQILTGPILSIPLTYEQTIDGQPSKWHKVWHLLPEELVIDGNMSPKTLRRGIYENVVYTGLIDASGTFNLSIDFDREHLKEVRWDKAYMTLGISDLRGIQEQLIMTIDGQPYSARPGTQLRGTIDSGVTFAPIDTLSEGSQLAFQTTIDLQGSENLQFVPVGGTTTVSIRSQWPDPSFEGAFLPDQRNISDEGFEARWQVLELNRNFPQAWVDKSQNLYDSAFGVRLLLPVDDYQKAIRSAKYGMMVIALTFLTFFLVEILAGRKIHPFQYALVGLAICLFYILLIAISEHLPFNFSYLIAAFIIVAIVTFYARSVFDNRQFTTWLLAGLCSIYGFLFVTLQVTDYALLMGSCGLTVLLGCTMYFTRNVNWYNLSQSSTHE